MATHSEHEVNERIQLILDSTPMSVTVYNIDRVMVDCNMGAVKMFGLDSKADFISAFNRRFYTFFPEYQYCGTPTIEKVNLIFETAEKEKCVQLEWSHLTADGQDLPTELTLVRVDHQGVTLFVAYVRDLRKIKEAEKKERESNEIFVRVQLVLDSAPMSVTLYDKNIKVFDCNMKAVELFEFADKDSFITEFNEHFFAYSAEFQPCGTPTAEKVKQVFSRAAAEGSYTFEWSYITANGNPVPTEATITRVDYQDTYILVAYVRDLREEKAAARKAQRLEVAEESNKAKSRFLARMSHEIRTPITAVMGISEVQLRNGTMPPQTEEAFAKIHNSSKTLLHIVNDILDFSKIEAGKMSLVEKNYDVANLVSDISQLHLIYLDEKDIKFQVYVDKNLPIKLIGDALRIRQIITNLLTNAFKYTESGTILLSLQFENIKSGQIMLCVAVHDTGVGMTADQLEEIENTNSEYLRLHEHEKPYVSGTGLGLSIVYSISKMMNAVIDVESTPNKGTRWLIRIPQDVAGSDILGEEVAGRLQNFETVMWQVAKGLEFMPEPMPHGKVLVVDDVETNLYVMEAMLDTFELAIELCKSGEEAIEKIKQGNVYDIIFLDHMMPNMDGIECTKILRDMGYNHPIVACTANALKGQAEMFIENGFSGFMSKPIEINRLNSYLMRYIKDKRK